MSQIVSKIYRSRYNSELYRIIDFCIFNKEYAPIVCIEINDNSHYSSKRKIRDNKVKFILKDAGIPLISLWTEYGININYIDKKISEIIDSKIVV